MGAYAQWLVRNRWVAAALLLALTVLAGWGATRVRLEDVPRKFLSAETDEWRQLEELFDQFGSDDGDCLILLTTTGPNGWFDAAHATLLRDVERRLRAINGIHRTLSLADIPVFPAGSGRAQPALPPPTAPPEAFAAAAKLAAAHPLLPGHLLRSRDGRHITVVGATVEADRTAIADLTPIVAAIRAAIATATAGTGVEAHLTGIPALRADIFNTLHSEQGFFALAGTLVGFLVALVMFRRPWPVLLTAGAGAVAAGWAVGAVGVAGVPLDILSVQLPTLVMVIAFTDAVHLMVHIRQHRAAGADARHAAIDAIQRLGPACALTSLTTAVGFGSLATGGLPVLQRYGLVLAAGVGFGFVAVITLLPLASTWCNLGLGAGAPGTPTALQRVCGVLGRFAVRRRWWVAGTGLGLIGLLCWPAFSLEPDNSITETLPRDTPSFVAMHQAERDFGGILPAFAVIEWEGDLPARWPAIAAALDATSAAIRRSPIPSDPVSLLDLLAAMPATGGDWRRANPAMLQFVPAEALHRFWLPQRRRTLVRFALLDAPSSTQAPQVAALATELAALDARMPDIRIWLTGTSIVARRNVNSMITALAVGLGVAAVVIFLVITIAFRSLLFGLLSLPVNGLPLLAAGSLLAWQGEPLQLTAAVAFTVCLGIAVDDTIHLLTRFRYELRIDGNVEAAVQRAVPAVGNALVITTLVFLCGFGIVGTSAMPVMRVFVVLACTGFAVALLCDLLLLPALLACTVRPPAAGGGHAEAPE